MIRQCGAINRPTRGRATWTFGNDGTSHDFGQRQRGELGADRVRRRTLADRPRPGAEGTRRAASDGRCRLVADSRRAGDASAQRPLDSEITEPMLDVACAGVLSSRSRRGVPHRLSGLRGSRAGPIVSTVRRRAADRDLQELAMPSVPSSTRRRCNLRVPLRVRQFSLRLRRRLGLLGSRTFGAIGGR